MERRLSTIVVADVVGYSKTMGENETESLNRLSILTSLIDVKAAQYGGRVFNRAGDGFLSEFSSPVSAVRFAFELQQELASPEMQNQIGFSLRIGIHLADVVVNGEDLLGDGINIAARIQSEAEPNTILVSSSVFEQVKRTAQLRFAPKGEKKLKNISDTFLVYSVEGELGSHSCITAIMADSENLNMELPTHQPNSVVVVPYKNLNDDPEQEYFADGFTEDLITELSRFPEVLTISRNASFGLKEKNRDAREIGEMLGVQYCLEGGIRKLGNKARINSFLINAVSGEQIWAEKTDCAYDELFDVQDELTSRIVSSVAGHVERQAEASAKRKRPNDLRAYDFFLRGMEFHRIGGVTQENAEQSVYWFDQALLADPKYGRAHAWRACAISTVAEWTGEDVWKELIESGRLAVELDETDADSHRIAGSLALYTKDFESALYHFKRAIELNPNHAFIVGRMGEIYNFLGDGKTALEYQKRAKLLDPFLPEYCRELEAVAYYVLEDYQRCYEVVGEFTRVTRRAAAYRTAAAIRLNDTEKIRKAASSLLKLDSKFDPKAFVDTEFYQDNKMCKQLRSDIKAGLSTLELDNVI